MGSNWMIINKQQSVGALFFLCKHFKSKHIRCIKEVEGASRSEKCLKHTFFPAGGGRLYKSLSVKFLGFLTWLPKASLRWPATAPVWSQVSTSQWTTSWYNHPFISYSMATTLPRHLTQTPQGASSTETVSIQQCFRYRGDLSIKIEPQQWASMKMFNIHKPKLASQLMSHLFLVKCALHFLQVPILSTK